MSVSIFGSQRRRPSIGTDLFRWKENAMRKRANPGLTTLCWIVLSMSSGCSAATLAPRLEDRRLYLKPDAPALFYEYEICVKKFLGICTKKAWHVDVYDLTDPEVRKQLIDVGFTATSERRWK